MKDIRPFQTVFSRGTLVTLGVLAGIVLFCAVVAYTAQKTDKGNAVIRDIERVQSDNTYVHSDGRSFDFRSVSTPYIIVTVWATWCPQCVEQLTALGHIQELNDNVTVVAINRKEDQTLINDFLRTYNLPQNITYVQDTRDYFFSQVGGYAMPETLVYRDGMIIAHERQQLLKDSIQTLLIAH